MALKDHCAGADFTACQAAPPSTVCKIVPAQPTAAEISAAIPNAREVIVGDSGHMTFIEQPQAFHDEVAGFLES